MLNIIKRWFTRQSQMALALEAQQLRIATMAEDMLLAQTRYYEVATQRLEQEIEQGRPDRRSSTVFSPHSGLPHDPKMNRVILGPIQSGPIEE